MKGRLLVVGVVLSLGFPVPSWGQIGGLGIPFEREVVTVEGRMAPTLEAYDHCQEQCEACKEVPGKIGQLSKSYEKTDKKLRPADDQIRHVAHASAHQPFWAWSQTYGSAAVFPQGSDIHVGSGFFAQGQLIEDVVFSRDDGLSWDHAVRTPQGYRFVVPADRIGIQNIRLGVKFRGKRSFQRILFIPIGGGRRMVTTEDGIQFVVIPRGGGSALESLLRYCETYKIAGGYPLIAPPAAETHEPAPQPEPPDKQPKKEPKKELEKEREKEPERTPEPVKFDMTGEREGDLYRVAFNDPDQVKAVACRYFKRQGPTQDGLVTVRKDGVTAPWRDGYVLEVSAELTDGTTVVKHKHMGHDCDCKKEVKQ